IGRETLHRRNLAAAFIIQGCPRMIVCGITRPLGRLSPTVGQVPHVLRTRLPLNGELPPRPVRLACVRHAASVRPEPGSNSPMRIQFSSNRTTVLPVVRITSESNPSRHASDRAPLVSGPHSTRSTINSQRAAQAKLPAQPTILTRPSDPSQGGLLLEDTPQVRRHAEEQLIAPRRAQTDDPAAPAAVGTLTAGIDAPACVEERSRRSLSATPPSPPPFPCPVRL